MRENGRKILIISIIFIIIIAILAIILTILYNVKQDKGQQIEELQPVIYYSFDEEAKMPLLLDRSVIANSPKITWTNGCSGIIKKDGKEFSKDNGTLLPEDGSYEITVTSNTGKNIITKTLVIDKAPPDVEIQENESGSYTIIFKDVDDIEFATLTKLDLETRKVVSETDLTEGGLKERIDIEEKGHYILNVEDKLGNINNGKTFSIK